MARPFPFSAVRPRSVGFNPSDAADYGPVSDAGQAQEVMNDEGVWRARMGGIHAVRERVPALRAVLAYAKAKRGHYYVGPQDCFHSPVAVAGRPARTRSVPWTSAKGEATWGGGELWSSSPLLARTLGSWPVGATLIRVTMTAGYALRAGQYFGAARRLYLIDHVRRLSGTNPNQVEVAFWPTLRAALLPNQALELERPVTLMKLVNASDLDLDLLRFGSVDLEWEEVV